MNHGEAQMDLIRRYARTLRVLHAEAMTARGPRPGAKQRRTGTAAERLSTAAQAAAEEAASTGSSAVPAA
jgi:hypothetical protein